MKILVAGATGVIGQRLIPLLVAAGHEVTAVARSEAKSRLLSIYGARPIRLDIFDTTAVERAVIGKDVVINMATHIPPTSKIFMPGAFNENNRIRCDASRNLARAATKAGAGRFIQESFAAAYPDCGDQWIEESTRLAPAKYVRTVLDAESAATDFELAGGVGVVLRFAFFYGPDSSLTRDIVKMTKKGIAPVMGRPEGYMSSIWLDDAASAVAAALRVPAGAYNISDDDPMRRRDAFNALASALGVKPPKMIPEWLTNLTGSVAQTLGRSQRLSNRKFREAAKWSPTVRSLREGWPLLLKQL
jgi:nucleoside-diphosphate-sugar epimerase